MYPSNPIIRSFLAFILVLSSTLLAPMANSASNSPSDLLDIGDRVKVIIFGHDDLSGEYLINSAGEITLPLIKSVQAEGRTLLELEDAIANKLTPDYLKDPKVSVLLTERRPFFILGEIKSPGSYPYMPETTVLKAVATAGGYTYRARKRKIIITRASTGKKEKVSDASDTLIRPGDVIEVPERFF